MTAGMQLEKGRDRFTRGAERDVWTYTALSSQVAQSCQTLCNPMDCSLLGSSIHGFSRQKYWTGLPFPSPGDLPYSGIKLGSPALQANSLPTELSGKPLTGCKGAQIIEFSAISLFEGHLCANFP